MTVFGCSLAILSLFTIHLHFISSLPHPGNEHGSQVTLKNTTIDAGGSMPTFRKTPLEHGHGPQLYPSGPKVPTRPALPRHFAWDPNLHIDKGNVVVVNVQTGEPMYTISQSPEDHLTTIVSNLRGDQLLSVYLKKTAGRGVKFVYNTPSGVHYKIDPRLAAPDHWYMMMEGHDPDVSYETLKYFRRRSSNTGPVEFRNHNHTQVASFEFVKSLDKTHWKLDTLGALDKFVTLEITQPTNIGDHYFIGLWALVKRRIDRYGL
ncbi:hypothetical protein PGTUg99_020899 [Puccinia graminis f. sp. tritici]|uniref:Uncharacterized protein n=1 Tax=Puccinia graminis f. sp. tritici TaxID=56615 RepID=A0A5B0M5Z9_PUCGR|nr:hypothetical protein PGTUg99_020899 [Puccinia graminis f. sp. tritici]